MQTQIKERPILFSGSMVRALLDGRKTQTRRIVKNVDPEIFPYCVTFDEKNGLPAITFSDDVGDCVTSRIVATCRQGKPGDRLWVRETLLQDTEGYIYRADGDFEENAKILGGWVPSIHMPRCASRILLEITNVRVERLNEISEEDAIAEGIKNYENGTYGLDDPGCCMGVKPSVAYMRLWNHINCQGSWDINPWVWIIDFKVISKCQQFI